MIVTLGTFHYITYFTDNDFEALTKLKFVNFNKQS